MEQQLELDLNDTPKKWEQSNHRVILVDLDRTLAHFTENHGPDKIGEPIAPMINRVKRWLDEGHVVRIFSARVGPHSEEGYAERARPAIIEWCKQHIGRELDVTAVKDWKASLIIDDRADGCEANTGRLQSERISDLEHRIIELETALDLTNSILVGNEREINHR
jgi:hypothetical protein